MTLKSELFTKPPSNKLNKCAVSDPDHIMEGVNDQGDHVGRIQTALLRLKNSDPSLQLPPISVEELGNQKYGASTAAAVLKYKQKRGIINPRYQKQSDNIVGIMTIASLDKDMVKFQNRPSIPGLPLPPIDPTPVPPSIVRRITRREFSKVDQNSGNDPENDALKDVQDGLLGLAAATLDPEATAQKSEIKNKRRIESLPAEHRVNRFTISVDISFEILKFGGTLTFTTTTMEYEWGPPLPDVIIENHFSSKVFDEPKKTFPTEFKRVPRATAEKTPFVVPPSVP
ncbi:MAG: peptidoglycan-binding domain-containing protein [Pyrinomonadaceae bacterium]